MSNNLEQYRSEAEQKDGEEKAKQNKPAAACFVHPKVIITTRSELLSRDPNYVRSFLPLELENKTKDEESEALEFFEEFRLAPFNDKLNEYIHALVALEFREAFAQRVGQLLPRPVDTSPEGLSVARAAGVDNFGSPAPW